MRELEFAERFINHYKAIEQQNFGNQIYLFRHLAFQGCGYYILGIDRAESEENKINQLNDLITRHRELFEESDLRDVLNNAEVLIEWIAKISSQELYIIKSKLIEIPYDIIEDVRKYLQSALSSDEDYLLNGAAGAMYFDAGLHSGTFDFRMQARQRKETFIWSMDEQFPYWPIAPIRLNDESIPGKVFAAKGPTFHWKNFRYELTDFFLSIINHANITTLVAIGHPGNDFPAYFMRGHELSTQQGLTSLIRDGVLIELEVEVTGEPEYRDNYSVHHITVKVKKTAQRDFIGDECELGIFRQTFTIYSVPADDGGPFTIGPEEFGRICLEILRRDEGIMVHCKAGMGRTGQLITFLLFLHQKIFKKTFSSDDVSKILQNIRVFIEARRRERPGFILDPRQLWLAVVYSFRANQKLWSQQGEVSRDEEIVEVGAERMGNDANVDNTQPKKSILSLLFGPCFGKKKNPVDQAPPPSVNQNSLS